MAITTNIADSFQGSSAASATNATSTNAFPPFSSNSGLVPPGADGDVLLILTSDVSNSTTTNVTVSDFSFKVTAGKLYLIESFLQSDAPGTTIGFQFGHGNPSFGNPPSGLADYQTAHYDASLTSTTTLLAAARTNAFNVATTNSLASPFDSPHRSIYIFRAANPFFGFPDTNTMELYFKSEVAGSAVVLKKGSFLRVREMN